MIGKPYSGKLNVRFDEGELEIEPMLLRQLSTLPEGDCQEIGRNMRGIRRSTKGGGSRSARHQRGRRCHDRNEGKPE